MQTEKFIQLENGIMVNLRHVAVIMPNDPGIRMSDGSWYAATDKDIENINDAICVVND